MSSKGGAKRQATAIITRVDRSHSPAAGANGTVASPSAMSSTSSHLEFTSGDRRLRTIALMNVPDTVNDSRLRAMAEVYGSLVKIVLRLDHQGVILEYTDAQNAGTASLGLEGREIAPGRHLRVGTVPEMLREKAEKRTDKIQVGKSKQDHPVSTQTSLSLQPSVPIRRPGQQGGRRGGLGQKRGLGFTSSNVQDERDSAKGSSEDGKSNQDFRALLTKK